jgi:1-acyl-sn-glycerol-3-phosphate acyltransferase
MRHVSTADTLLPVLLFSRRHGVRLRYVMKRELLWDPCLDVVGQRVPSAFVRRDSGQPEREVALVVELGRGLGPRSGVLVYPEGTRFTAEKRLRALERIAASNQSYLLERAGALEQVLPPGTVLLDEPRTHSNLLYIFVISGALRGLIALFLRGRVRELRKPRKEITPHALVLRITGFNAMLGVIYDFIGRPSTEAEERDEPGAEDVSERPRSGDNTP